eukprot:s331_g13.t1
MHRNKEGKAEGKSFNQIVAKWLNRSASGWDILYLASRMLGAHAEDPSAKAEDHDGSSLIITHSNQSLLIMAMEMRGPCEGKGHKFALQWAIQVSQCKACFRPCGAGSLVKTCENCSYMICVACSMKAAQTATQKTVGQQDMTCLGYSLAQPQLAPGTCVPQHVAPPRYVGVGGVAQRSWVPHPAGGPASLLPAGFKYPDPRQCGASRSSAMSPAHEMFQAKRVSMQPLATDQSTAPPRVTPGLQQVWCAIPLAIKAGLWSSASPKAAGCRLQREASPKAAGCRLQREASPKAAGCRLQREASPKAAGCRLQREASPKTAEYRPLRKAGTGCPESQGLANLLLGPADFKFYPEPRPCDAATSIPTPDRDTFQTKTPVSKKPVATLEEHTALAHNKDGLEADGCTCTSCLETALDSWKPDEIQSFTSKGGNQKVNNDLLRSGGPPPPARGAPRSVVDDYIRKKYGGEKAADEKRRTIGTE